MAGRGGAGAESLIHSRPKPQHSTSTIRSNFKNDLQLAEQSTDLKASGRCGGGAAGPGRLAGSSSLHPGGGVLALPLLRDSSCATSRPGRIYLLTYSRTQAQPAHTRTVCNPDGCQLPIRRPPAPTQACPCAALTADDGASQRPVNERPEQCEDAQDRLQAALQAASGAAARAVALRAYHDGQAGEPQPGCSQHRDEGVLGRAARWSPVRLHRRRSAQAAEPRLRRDVLLEGTAAAARLWMDLQPGAGHGARGPDRRTHSGRIHHSWHLFVPLPDSGRPHQLGAGACALGHPLSTQACRAQTSPCCMPH